MQYLVDINVEMWVPSANVCNAKSSTRKRTRAQRWPIWFTALKKRDAELEMIWTVGPSETEAWARESLPLETCLWRVHVRVKKKKKKVWSVLVNTGCIYRLYSSDYAEWSLWRSEDGTSTISVQSPLSIISSHRKIISDGVGWPGVDHFSIRLIVDVYTVVWSYLDTRRHADALWRCLHGNQERLKWLEQNIRFNK